MMELLDEVSNLLCMACLCVGRTIRKITDEALKQYYMNILNEIPLCITPQGAPVVCWECEAVLKKVLAFKEQVKDSYRILQTYTKENLCEFLLSEVGRPPRLKVHNNECVSVAPDHTYCGSNEDEIEIDIKFKDCKQDITEIETVICDGNTKPKHPLRGKRRQLHRPKEGSGEDCIEVKSENHEVSRSRSDSQSSEEIGLEEMATVLCDIKGLRNRGKESNFDENDTYSLDIKYKEDQDVAESAILDGNSEENDTMYEQNGLTSEADSDEPKKVKVKKKKDSSRTKNKNVARVSNASNKYKMVSLSYEELQAERAARARRSEYVRATHKCRTCVRVFATAAARRLHDTNKHSPELGEYICPICYTIVSAVEAFTAHYKRHVRRYECGVCMLRTADVKAMDRHVGTHETAHAHKKQERSNARAPSDARARVACGSCDKTFSHRAGLMNHRLAVHEARSEFPCGACDKVFRWKTSLKRHLEKHKDKGGGGADAASGAGAGAAYCGACELSFASVCSLQRHLRNSLKHVTQDQLKFICEHCNKRFADKTKLRNHIEEKHLHWTYTCQLCGKPSKNRVGLEQHVRNVHKGRPNNKICHHCGKGFPTKVQLESHIRTHTGERPFICEFCPTTFSQQSNLYKHHRQVHLNIKSKRYSLCKRRRTEGPSEPQEGQVLPYYDNMMV